MARNDNYDFGGYATKHGLKCSDGRVIMQDAFKGNDGGIVPLVWQHMHESPGNILGHAYLEHRTDGVYAYCYFNESEDAKKAKLLVHHGDIVSLSIYANSLIEKSRNVVHGVIREVSLVISGANPGAVIDNVSITHADGSSDEIEDEAVIFSGASLDFPQRSEEIKEPIPLKHADDEGGETVAEVFNTLTDKQKEAVYVIVGQLMEGEGDDEEEMEQSAIKNLEGDPLTMKKNVFDAAQVGTNEAPVLSHSDFMAINENAKKLGSLKAAFMAHEAGAAYLAHAGTYGIDNIDYLFPDAQSVSAEPDFIARKMGWVPKVFNGARHVPFSRIKSVHADITPDAARAKGYVTGNLKTEEVFSLLRRITTPHTIYKKQKLDRDDIVDITDMNVVAWLKKEMRWMLDEEIARAMLVSDGRDPVAEVDDHIPTDKIRPIWTDSDVYAYHKLVASTRTTAELIDDLIMARIEYRGTGSPSMYVGPTFLAEMLLLRDLDGRRLYRTEADLAAELRVSEIVEIPIFDGLHRTITATEYDLKAIVVNLSDYTLGADKGGEVNMFDDFDIDYNQYKYLIETRASGALVVPKSALVLEQAQV